MIRLGGLVNQKAFGKFEMGKVISNPFATAFIKEGEGEDHEVSMANNSLDTIIKMATELKAKMGENEKDIPAWIQDHITNAENFISQASSNYHEYGQNEGVVNEDSETNRLEKLIKNLEETNKLLLQNLNHTKSLPNNKKENIKKSIAVNLDLINYYKKWLKDYQSAANESLVKEDSPCWKGYKQVGMKNKGGRQVPNCVPNESIVKEAGLYGGVPKMYVKYLAVQKKVRELEDAQRAMGAKYFAEKNPKKKEAMMPLLKKGTNQLEMYRRNLADIERKYIDNLYKDVEQSPDFE